MKRLLLPLLAALALPTNAFANTCRSLLNSKGYESSEWTQYKRTEDIQISYSSNFEHKFEKCKNPFKFLTNAIYMRRDNYYLSFLFCNGYQLYSWDSAIEDGLLFSWNNDKATSFLVSDIPIRTTKKECIKIKRW